jgi:hypothetical protein
MGARRQWLPKDAKRFLEGTAPSVLGEGGGCFLTIPSGLLPWLTVMHVI